MRRCIQSTGPLILTEFNPAGAVHRPKPTTDGLTNPLAHVTRKSRSVKRNLSSFSSSSSSTSLRARHSVVPSGFLLCFPCFYFAAPPPWRATCTPLHGNSPRVYIPALRPPVFAVSTHPPTRFPEVSPRQVRAFSPPPFQQAVSKFLRKFRFVTAEANKF